MSYLLDTNAWIHYLNHRNSTVALRIATLSPDEVLLCSIVKAELNYGAEKSAQRDHNRALLVKLFSQFSSLPFDDQAAEVCGRIRAELSTQGTLIGPNDLLIASIAIANNLILVTHNVAEFSRVNGLQMEDWQ